MVAGARLLPQPGKSAVIRSIYYLAVGASIDVESRSERSESQVGAAFLAGAIIALGLLRWMVPKFAVIFAGRNARLPPITEFVVDTSHAVSGTLGLLAYLMCARFIAAALNHLVRSSFLTESSQAKRSLAEPVLIVVVGAVVGLIVISMYLPLFKVHQCV